MGLSYPTVLKAFHIIRKAVTANSVDGEILLQGEIEADETYFGGKRKGKRGRGARNKIPVFGILERKGIVKVKVLRNVTAEEILNHTIKTVRRGSIVYTDKFKSYNSLMFCGYRHLRIDHGKRFSRGKVYINGLEGFWSYAKERIIKFHGVSKERFPFYLKEMEFRYNHREKPVFNILAQYLCNLVAKHL
jgi:transposase